MTMNPQPTRRLFFGVVGAAAAAPLAFAAPAAAVPGGGDLAARLARLEDQDALRVLQAAYVRLVNARMREELAELFATADAAHLDEGVRSLIGADPADDRIQIAADGTTAVMQRSFIVETETPIEGEGTIVAMARLQGDGVVRRSERRTLEIAAAKRDGVWKIQRTSWLAE